MKRSIRLDNSLVKKAEAKGGQLKRSIASQIEYWAEIGMAAEESNQVSRDRLEALSRFNSAFMDRIQKNVASGEFRKRLLKTGFAYEKSKMGPGFVDKVFPDDTRVTGRVVNGEFVELKARSRAK